MVWLITGAAGMLGTEVGQVLDACRVEWSGLRRADLDLLDEAAVTAAVAGHDVVVNCAGWTAVDDAEAHEGRAFAINATAAAILARAARRADARIMQISSDYVFPGDAAEPYAEDAPLHPLSAYGRTKAAGEWAVRTEAPEHAFVVRSAWMYGAHGACFPRTILRLVRERGTVAVVDDQRGQPTWARDVAELLVQLVDADAPAGVWHATSSGETSWYDFARTVVAAAGLPVESVTRTSSKALVRPASRPAYSVLGHERLRRHGLTPIGQWDERWSVAASNVLALQQAE